jgi:hypothetical protein
MANEEQLELLMEDTDQWNEWREENPDIEIDLSGADLEDASLTLVNLSEANLVGANLKSAFLVEADLSNSNLRQASMQEAILHGVDLSEADLRGVQLAEAELREANLTGATLTGADLQFVDFSFANLSLADLVEADLRAAMLVQTDLKGANLSGANLAGAQIIGADIEGTKISGCRVFAANAWDLIGEFYEQQDLILTAGEDPVVTVDDIRIAQFIQAYLRSEAIRKAASSISFRAVLILGRFEFLERKAVMKSLTNKLREYGLLPIVVDLDPPSDDTLNKTVNHLSEIAWFVIADLTNPRTYAGDTRQAEITEIEMPLLPILQEGTTQITNLAELQKSRLTLEPVQYTSAVDLAQAVTPELIDAAIQMHNELVLNQAREPKVKTWKDLRDEKGEK